MVLGCTHYPLLKPLLRRLAPPAVTIVDSAESTAQAVAQQLTGRASVSKPETRNSKLTFFSTDSVEKFRRLGARFLGHPVEDVAHVDLDRLP
jgi:glutamate racemase